MPMRKDQGTSSTRFASLFKRRPFRVVTLPERGGRATAAERWRRIPYCKDEHIEERCCRIVSLQIL